MRIFLAWLSIFFLLTQPASAAFWVFMGGPVVETAGGGEQQTFLLDESFDGTTAPTGWTVEQGSADWSKNGYVELPASTQTEISSPAISTTSKVYCAFKFKVNTLDNTGDTRLVYGKDSTSANVFDVSVRATDVLRAYHGTANASSSTISAGTWYYLWIDYEKASSGDGTLDARLGTTGVYADATSFASIITGTSTTDLAEIRIAQDVNTTTAAVVFSDVKVSESAIGDLPEYEGFESFDTTTANTIANEDLTGQWSTNVSSNNNCDHTPGLDSSTQALELDGVTQGSTVTATLDLGVEYPEVWLRVTFKNMSAADGYLYFISFENDASTNIAYYRWMTDGTGPRLYYSPTEYAGSSTDLALSTEYTVWIHWKGQVSGNDGEIHYYVDTAAPYERPVSEDITPITTGNAGTNGDGIRYITFSAGSANVFEIDEVYYGPNPLD